VSNPLIIGTRESALALWQTRQVVASFSSRNITSEIVPIKSEGDINLVQPLYELGVQGIFTKTLDIALLNGRIDLAVHSFKDVPTQIPQGLTIAAVLKRGDHRDVMVLKDGALPGSLDQENLVIATSSLRRRAQWLHHHPTHVMENLRGNIQKRLEKLQTNASWHGAIFAAAALERLELKHHNVVPMPWMLPAPAQGAMVVICRVGDQRVLDACAPMHHGDTALCVQIEREFLRRLLGGCATPVGALATTEDETIHFKGNLFSPDGKVGYTEERKTSRALATSLAATCAKDILERGGHDIIRGIRDVATT
jgi:hydroxymethylbilane synthase